MATKSERDWKELPKDLVGLIAERLSVISFIHLSTVCTSWASALDGGVLHGLYRPQGAQSPWLLLPGEQGDHGEFSDTCTFFSIADNKSYTIALLPELHGKWVVGSTEGWLVTLDEASEARLLNPFTRAQIMLPSPTTFPDVQVVHNSRGDITEFILSPYPDIYPPTRWTSEIFRYNYIIKAVLSSSPTPTSTSTSATHDNSGGYIVMAIFWPENSLAYFKPKDDKWRAVETRHGIHDVIYHKGKFYSISWRTELQAWDLSRSSPEMMTILEPVETDDDFDFTKYLVESSEELLLVCRRCVVNGFHGSGNVTTKAYTTTEVVIFKFDPWGAKWIRVTSLGDQCLFFGLSRSMSLSARDIPGLMPNCIYFTDDHRNSLHCYHKVNCDITVFNLEDGSFSPYYPYVSLKNWSAPIWFMPNLLL